VGRGHAPRPPDRRRMTRLPGVGGTYPYPQLCPAHRRRPGPPVPDLR
jgi:hypothetical protein